MTSTLVQAMLGANSDRDHNSGSEEEYNSDHDDLFGKMIYMTLYLCNVLTSISSSSYITLYILGKCTYVCHLFIFI